MTNLEQTLTPPWKQQDVKPFIKLAAMFGVTVFLCIGIQTVVIFVTGLISLGTPELWTKPGSILSALFFILLIPLAVLGLCGFALKKIWRYAAAPRDFKVSSIAPENLGQSFEVKFSHLLSFTSRSLNEKGFCRFEPEQMVLEGTLWPTLAYQLGIVVIVTAVPLVLFGIGLGLIPALILAVWLGKKQVVLQIPYAKLQTLSIKGRTISISMPEKEPNKAKFTAAMADGERLYRELFTHSPQAVTEWPALQELFTDVKQIQPDHS